MNKPKYGLNEISFPELIDIFRRNIVGLLILVVVIITIVLFPTRSIEPDRYYTSSTLVTVVHNTSNNEFQNMIKVLYSQMPQYLSDDTIIQETLEVLGIQKFTQDGNSVDGGTYDCSLLLGQAKNNIEYFMNYDTNTFIISFSHNDAHYSSEFLSNLLITIDDSIRETLSQQLKNQYEITRSDRSMYENKLKSTREKLDIAQDLQDYYRSTLNIKFRQNLLGDAQIAHLDAGSPVMDIDHFLLKKEFEVLTENLTKCVDRLAILDTLFPVLQQPILTMRFLTTNEQIVKTNKSSIILLGCTVTLILGLFGIVLLEIHKDKIASTYQARRILGKDVNVISFPYYYRNSKRTGVLKPNTSGNEDTLTLNFGPLLAFFQQGDFHTDMKVVNMINLNNQQQTLPLSYSIAIAASLNTKRVLVINFDNRSIESEKGIELLNSWPDRLSFELLDVNQPFTSPGKLKYVTIATLESSVHSYREIVYSSEFVEYIKVSEAMFDLILIVGPVIDDLSIQLPISSIADRTVVSINSNYPSRIQLENLDMLFSLSGLHVHGVILEDSKA